MLYYGVKSHYVVASSVGQGVAFGFTSCSENIRFLENLPSIFLKIPAKSLYDFDISGCAIQRRIEWYKSAKTIKIEHRGFCLWTEICYNATDPFQRTVSNGIVTGHPDKLTSPGTCPGDGLILHRQDLDMS